MQKIENPRQDWWWAGVVGYGCLGIALGGVLWWWKKIPPEVPWLYSLPWGEQQLMNKGGLLIGLLGLGIGLTVTMWWAKLIAKKEDQEIAKTMARAGLLIVGLYLLSLYRMLRLMLGK